MFIIGGGRLVLGGKDYHGKSKMFETTNQVYIIGTQRTLGLLRTAKPSFCWSKLQDLE